MSRFLDGISTIISFFYKYAKEDGDCSNLSRRKMQEFIQREFADVIAKPRDPQTIDKILQFLEWDGDGHIDFNEFLLLVFRVAKACYWLQPKGPYLLQRTKLTSSGKLHQEPEIKNRGSSRQLQEEEEQTCESNHHPPCEPELQRDTRVNELETLEETGSYQQRNTESVNDAKRSSERREPTPQVYEERSREPCDQRNSQRRRQPPEPNRRGDVQVRNHRSLEAHEPRLRRDERKYQERPQQDQLADMRSRSQTCETGPLQNRWGSRQPHEPVGPANDDRNQRPQEADRGSDNQPRKPELLTEERSRYHLRELEQRALEESSHKLHEPECLDSRGPYQSYIKEPLEIDLRYCKTCELERRIDEQVNNEEHNLEYVETESENHKTKEREERDDARRKDRAQDRRVDMQKELDLEVYELRSRQTCEREERGAKTNQRERRERRDFEAREAEIDGRRQRDLVSIQRTQEIDVVAAEPDVKIHRVSRELETREEVERRERDLEHLDAEEERRTYLEREIEKPARERRLERQRELDLEIIERHNRQTCDWEERGAKTNQRERQEGCDFEAREAEVGGRRQRGLLSTERTRETDVVAAEADLKIHRVSRELEPRNELRRRERDLERLEAEEERRIYLEREIEEPLRERRLERQRELDLEIIEHRRHQTHDREERGAKTNQRERHERRDLEAREAEMDGRRQRDLVSIERIQETEVAAAEADVKIHSMSRELEPRNKLRRRERDLEYLEAEEERRIYLEREREEPVRERRLERQRELDLEVYERHSRQTRDWEERGPNIHQRERRERRDLEAREDEIDGRRQHDLVSIERTRETDVVAAEADLKIHRVSRELEPRNELRRRERDLERLEAEEERRIYLEREIEEPARDRRLERQRELDLEIIESRSHQTHDREERGAKTNQRERRHFEAREAEMDGRRQRDLVSVEKTRETDVFAAEADLKIHRVSRELEPRNELRRRERDLERLEAEEERRIYLEREREEPVRERRLERQREMDLEIIERRSRQTRDWEERGAKTNQRERCERRDFEAREAEIDGRRPRDLVSIQRTRETDVVAAEADVKIHHVSRELEPRNELRRRERDLERLEAEEERRIYLEREREEPMRDRRLERQQELDLEIIERHSRQTRDREERGPNTHQRDRRDFEAREAEMDGRRQRDLVSVEKTRETDVFTAEADVKIHRVSRELEPRNKLRRRERDLEYLEAEEERRIYLEREREEPVRERRLERQREMDLEVYERHSRQTRDWEERGPNIHQRERRERRDLEAREDEIDGRRQHDLVSIERTRETDVVAAEADLKIHRVSRELEPRNELRRRERDLERLEAEEERRIYLEREIEEPAWDRRLERQRELDLEIIESRSHQTHDREERGAKTNQRERRHFEAREAEMDGRRQRDLVSVEKTRETDVFAAEADLKIHRVSRELEPRNELRRRERDLERLEAEEERRIYLEREREEPVRERRLERQREMDLEIIERRSRQTRDWEERGAKTNQRERCERRDFEAREAEIDGRRPRDLVSIQRTRETDVVAAEADVKIHHVSRELEPRNELRRRERDLERLEAEEERRIYLEREREEPMRDRRLERQQELDLEIIERRSRQTRDREERGPNTHQRDRRDFEAREAEMDGRRQRDLVSVEKTRETDVFTAEADVKIHRVSRELEPRNELRRRERDLERLEAEEERRIYLEREREEPVRERRLKRQREMDLEVYEHHNRQTRDWEERGAKTNQRERRERCDFEAHEAEMDGRRQRDLVSIHRTRETDVVAAEADLKIHRVSRELEPRNELRRRERDLEHLEAEEERRIYLEREIEEPLRERRLERQREMDLEIIERRSRQTRDWEERGAKTNQRERCERRDLEAHEAEIDGRRQRDLVSNQRTRETDVVAAEADVKIHHVSRELEPRNELRRRERDLERLEAEEERRIYLEREREEPVRERRLERQRELDLEIIERRSHQTRDWEERGAKTNQRERCERRDFEAHEAEMDGRRQRDLVSIHRTRETDVVAAEADLKIHRVSRELEPRNELRRRERDLERLEAEEERRIYLERDREEPMRERRVERQRELDLEVYERRSHQTRDREERDAKTNQRERRERCDFEAREAEIDGRRQRDLVTLEKTRETDVVAAEADLKIHHMFRELEPRNELRRRERDLEHLEADEERRIYLEREREEPVRERRLESQRELDLEVIERRSRQTRDWEERGANTHQRERCERRDFEAREAEIDGRMQRDLVSIEKTRETDVVAAEADLKIHRVSRELEPRNELRRRERDLERLEAEEERRIYLEREIEEPLRERRLERQREMDLEIIERRSRQTRDWEERGAKTNQRERCERRDLEAHEAEIDGRRQRDLVSNQRTRETDVVAAEADVKIHRVSRELEPRNELRRRERDLERLEAEEERRIYLEREREEPVRERRLERQRELDLEIIERRSHQTRDWEERGAKTNQRERCERRDFEAHEAEMDGRRQRDLVSIHRTRETDVVAAEADLKIHRVSRELEPRNELRRRERDLERLEEEEERRIYLERERAEPVRERRLERQREMDLEVMERCSHQTRDREERGPNTHQRERCDFEAREAEMDGRRQRDLVSIEKTRETDVFAAEADLKIHRVSRELEPRNELRRRERDLERLEAEEERRIYLEREREEPLRERRLERQRELDLEIIEHRSRQTRDWEERGAKTNQRERQEGCEFEAHEAEIDGRRQRDLVSIQRTRETDVVAAEADLKIHRVSRELEPRNELRRRERDLERLEAEEERRIYLERKIEEPLRERRLERQRELDLEIIERRSRQTRDWEERGAKTNQRERCERRDFEAHEAEMDGRRQRDLVSIHRTRETDVVAAEADLKIHRVSRELEPRNELRRRERDLERLEAEEERRIYLEREREEPVRERRLERQREMDLEVMERCSHQTRDREERGPNTHQRERCDFEAREAEMDGRRQRDLVSIEKTRETDVFAAEADLKIHRVSRELEPRNELRRRERDLERLEAEEERRIYLEREREEPARERRLERQRELDLEIIERRSHQTRDWEERGAKTNQRERCERRDFEAREAEIDGRRQRDLVSIQRTRETDVVAAEADVKIHHVSRELEPRNDLRRRERDPERLEAEEERRIYLEREREEPMRERRLERQQELDLEIIERRSRQTRDREERGPNTHQRDRRDFEAREAEMDGRRQRDLVSVEKTRETDVFAAEADLKIHRMSRELEPRNELRRREHDLERLEAEEERRIYLEREREEPVRERRLKRQRELDLEVYEHHNRQTRDWEERGAKTNQRERRERCDFEAHEAEMDGRRQRDLVSIHRTRETDVVAAEADLKIHRVSRELETRNELRRRERDLERLEAEEERRIYLEREIEEPLRERRLERQREMDLEIIERRSRQTRDWEERGAKTNQRERQEGCEFEAREAEIGGRRQRDLVSIQMTRETDVVAAEADLKIHRVSRELEPRNELRRRERDLERLEAEEERRIYLEREREEPVRERRLERQRELDLEIIEHRSRQTRDWEERGAKTNQRERCERRDFEAREAEMDGRRQRDLVSIQRTRETDVVAAEADLKIHRVSRELEPRNELRRRERDLEYLDAEEERRIYLEREIEEPARDRRLERQRELDLEVIECRSHQTSDREELGPNTHQRDRRDFEAREAEMDGRRQRDLVTIEKTRETDVVAAEADVKIHRVSRELEPRNELRRRERDLERLEAEEERRIYLEREIEEPLRERRLERQREMDLQIIERRRHQTHDRKERGPNTHQRERCERRDLEAREAEMDGRRQRDLVSVEKTRETDVFTAEADVKIHRVSRELEPRNELRRRERDLERLEAEEERRIYLEREREEPMRERRLQRQQELDLEVYERRSHQTRDREERGAKTNQRERRERCDFEAREAEIDGRRQRDLVTLEKTRETDVVAAEADVKIHHMFRELEPRNELRRRERDLEHLEADEERRIYLEREREEPVRERRLESQRELDLEVIERRSRQTRDWEERGANTHQRERCERRDFEAREAEIDGRMQRDLVSIEKTRETDVVAAEADLKIHRVSRELEPRNELRRRERDLERLEAEEERRIYLEREIEEPLRERRLERQQELDLEVIEHRRHQTHDRKERGPNTHQRERCKRRDLEAREPETDGRRQRDLVSIQRTRETDVVAAEADLKIHRVSRELEPRNELRRRERDLERLEAEEERRIYLERDREEPMRERRVERQRELDLEVYERRSHQTRDREERGAKTNQRERRERCDFEAREAEIDGRRQRDLVTLEKTRETDVVAAEADLKIHHMFRELEPRNELRRRERDLEHLEADEERRIYLEREREEPVRERRLESQRELDLEVIERRSRQTRDWEERGANTHQRERCERRDFEAREAEIDGRMQRDLVSIEKTRETDVVAAEADLKIHRVSRELEPRNELRRRERDLERLEAEEERRIYLEREIEEPLRERRLERQQELDLEVIEHRRHQTHDRKERGPNTHQRERCKRRDLEAREPETDGRRQRDLVSIQRTRETDVVAAEADLKIHRVSRELEPRNELRRRERDLERLEAEEERRIYLERDREEPMRERRVERQRELDLEVYERRSHQTRDREERGAKTNQRERRERCEFESREAEINGRRQRGLLSTERTRETDVVAAEADLKIHRVSRELEPRNELRRRERDLEHLDAEEERRIYRERAMEDPVRERRLERQRELDLEIIERRSRQTRDREERGAKTSKQTRERNLYQAIDVDNSDLCLPGDQASVTDMRVSYIPAEPDVPPEVKVAPHPCDPQTNPYLVRVIQNLNDSDATTYEIVCHQPHDLGKPIYVKKGYVSSQPLVVPSERSNNQEPRPQRSEREIGERELPSSSQENTGDLNEPLERSEIGMKEGAYHSSASELSGVKGDPCQAKSSEDRRDSQRPKRPDAEEKKHQPRGYGSKTTRQQVPLEPESSCQVREREDREAKSCPPLPQALEPQKACKQGRQGTEDSRSYPSRRDEARRCCEDAKSRQPRQENIKRRHQEASDGQPQWKGEPRQ